MKNFKRIILLITLIFVASQVLSSDFELFESESTSTVIASK
ncbi:MULTISPECIES: hypothetical protein [Algibacter]|nr:hypothetical protein [Algibacter pectinivorans]